jgi:hypothetical protein
MNYIKKIPLLLLILLIACTNQPKSAQNISTTDKIGTEGVNIIDTSATTTSQSVVTPIVGKVVRNYTVVPKQQFGDITPATTEADLKRIYGDSNVVRTNRGLVQTVIFPKSGSEIEIAWKHGQTYKKIESIIVRQGKFQTPEGIHIGSTLKDLEAANGKPVKLAPVNDEEMRPIWQGGKVNPQLVLSYDQYADRVFGIQINF